MKVINPSLRIGDIVRIIQPNFARLNTHWYDRREQQLIAYAVGRRAQVRSIYEYNGNVRYKLLIEGISRTTTYGFELHEIPYDSAPSEPFPTHVFALGEPVAFATQVYRQKPKQHTIERITYFNQYGDIRYRLHDNPKYYKHTELVSLTAPSLGYTLF